MALNGTHRLLTCAHLRAHVPASRNEPALCVAHASHTAAIFSAPLQSKSISGTEKSRAEQNGTSALYSCASGAPESSIFSAALWKNVHRHISLRFVRRPQDLAECSAIDSFSHSVLPFGNSLVHNSLAARQIHVEELDVVFVSVSDQETRANLST